MTSPQFIARLAGVFYLITFVTGFAAMAKAGGMTFVLPVARQLVPYNMIPGIVAEGALTLWLLIKGVNTERWLELGRARS